MTTFPTAEELFSEVRLVTPTALIGRFIDRRPNGTELLVSLGYQAPTLWFWFLEKSPPTGFISDGKMHTIIEDGTAAAVLTEGSVHPGNRLQSLLRPSFLDVASLEFGDVNEGNAAGRQVWMIPITDPRKRQTGEIAFDCETRIIIHIATQKRFLGFEQIAINEPLPPESFVWSGPTSQRKLGIARINRLEEDERWHVHWEIGVEGRTIYHQDGPAFLEKARAVAWAAERSNNILFSP